MTKTLGINAIILAGIAAALFVPQANAADGYGGAGTYGYGSYEASRGPGYGGGPFSSRHVYRDWSGPYIGGFLGGTWSDFDKDTPFGASGDDSAFIGGLDLGFNAPMRGLILGGEADIASMDNRVKGFGGYKYTQNWTSTFRARLGVDLEGVMPYATAGLALTDVEQRLSGFGKETTLQAGFTAGGGIDIMLPQRWFARVEYLYIDVPKDTKTLGGIPVSGGSANNTVRFGLNYRF